MQLFYNASQIIKMDILVAFNLPPLIVIVNLRKIWFSDILQKLINLIEIIAVWSFAISFLI